MGRWWLVGWVAAALVGLGACGSGRTKLPTAVEPPPTLEGAAVQATKTTEVTVVETGVTEPPTTASAFKSPGEKHPLPGGTLAASYPRVGVRPPKGVAPPPAGQQWALVNVRFCADPAVAITPDLVDPKRFEVEVPGQGSVAPTPDAPALSKTPLAAGGPGVSPGTCMEGSIAYLVAGEGHIESVTYDTGAGLLRWAT